MGRGRISGIPQSCREDEEGFENTVILYGNMIIS